MIAATDNKKKSSLYVLLFFFTNDLTCITHRSHSTLKREPSDRGGFLQKNNAPETIIPYQLSTLQIIIPAEQMLILPP